MTLWQARPLALPVLQAPALREPHHFDRGPDGTSGDGQWGTTPPLS
jgi:hypothetical protein